LVWAKACNLLRNDPSATLLIEEGLFCRPHGPRDEAAFTTQAEQQLLGDRIHLAFGAGDAGRVKEIRRRVATGGEPAFITVVYAVLVGVDEFCGAHHAAALIGQISGAEISGDYAAWDACAAHAAALLRVIGLGVCVKGADLVATVHVVELADPLQLRRERRKLRSPRSGARAELRIARPNLSKHVLKISGPALIGQISGAEISSNYAGRGERAGPRVTN
jgi:hypothetical protein